MQWDDSHAAGFSGAPIDALYAPLVSSPGFTPQDINVADQLADPGSLLAAVKAMIKVRKSLPALATGKFSWTAVEPAYDPNPIAAYYREDDQQKILILQNLSPDRRSFHLKASAPATYDLLMGNSKFSQANGELSAELEPYGYLWLELKPS